MAKSEEKSQAKQLKEKLFSPRKNGILRITDKELAKCDKYCEDYKLFLDKSKTEREAVRYAVTAAEKAGFRPFERGMKLVPGDRIYTINRGKAVMLAVIGTEDISHGVHIAAAHIDSPRLDLKQNPLYEDSECALFKTHYYGGIKKYQWTTIPLSLHGVIVRADGASISVNIGRMKTILCSVLRICCRILRRSR